MRKPLRILSDPIPQMAAMMATQLRDQLQAALGALYTIERELTAGGMSRVFVANEHALGRRIVIKVLPPDLAASVSIERFRREIRLAASLDHPHIVPVHTAGEADGLLYYTMPFIEGESLRERLKRDVRLPIDEAIQIAIEVADALEFAHARGVVHRDIKPENILLHRGHATVADFGIARAIIQSDAAASLTMTGVSVGTPMYMSPEQTSGDPGVDGRSDIYSLGCVTYEMIAGHPPYSGPNAQAIVFQAYTGDVPLLGRVRPNVPRTVEASVARAMAKDRDERFARARDFALAFRHGAPSSSRSVTALQRLSSRTLWLGAAFLLVATVTLAWVAWRGARSGGPAADPTRLAIFPFATPDVEGTAYLREGMVDLLSTSLDGAGDFRTVDPRGVMRAVRQESGDLDPDAARRVARRLGAGRFVLGAIITAGRRQRATAVLYATDGSNEPLARADAEAADTALFALVDELSSELLVGTSQAPGRRLTLAQTTTPSLPALKAYLHGESEMRVGRYSPASDAFAEAVRHDSSFALGWFRLAVALPFLGRDAESMAALLRAEAMKQRLTQRYQMLVEAMLAEHSGQDEEAVRSYEAVLLQYPDDVEALLSLGNVLFLFQNQRGHPLNVSKRPYARALELEPNQNQALTFLRVIAGADGDSADYDVMLGRFLRSLAPDAPFLPSARLELALLRNDSAEIERTLAELRSVQGYIVGGALGGTILYLARLPESRALARVLTDPSRSNIERADGHAGLAHIEAALGRWAAARSELARAEALDSVYGVEHRAMLALNPFARFSRPELEQIRARIGRWRIPDSLPGRFGFRFAQNEHEGIHRHIRLYVLAGLSTRLRDGDAATAYADSLSRLGGTPQQRLLANRLALTARAEQAFDRGNFTEALALLERQQQGPSVVLAASWWYAVAHRNYLQAVLYDTLSRPAEALRWYRARTLGRHNVAWSTASLLGAARMHERLGQRPEAITAYDLFGRLWNGADDNLRPVVERAAQSLARLRRDSR